MGTYAYFALSLIVEADDKNKYSEKEIISHFRGECDNAESALDEDGNTGNEAKWYEFDTDLRRFSKKYPTVIFKLTLRLAQGDEEERDNEWDNYYKDGEEFSEPPIKTEWEIWMEKSIAARNRM